MASGSGSVLIYDLNPAPSRCRNLRLACGHGPICCPYFSLRSSRNNGQLGSIAHYGLGITRGDIRIDALGAAGFIVLGLAGSTLLKRNK